MIPDDAPACDLDPAEFNVGAASWRASSGRWVAPRHGVGVAGVLARCDCAVCVAEFERLTATAERLTPKPQPPEPEPPHTTDVAPVRAHVAELLAAGWTRTELATHASVDRTTVARLFRPDVRRVHVDSARALLAIEPSSTAAV